MSKTNYIFWLLAASLAAATSGCSGGSDNPPSSVQTSTAADLSPQAETADSLSDSAQNTAPVVNSVTFALQKGNSHLIMLDAFDDESNELTWEMVTQPDNGLITGSPPMMLYKPDPSFEGPDRFEVKVSDGELSSPATTITLVVSSIVESPVPAPQSLVTVKDIPLPVSLSVEGEVPRDLFYILRSFPQHGRLTGEIPNLTYIPDAGFEGTDRFHFSVGDSNTLSSTATIDILVVYPTRLLNDTGVTWGANYPSGNNVQCEGETVREQDCSKGFDAEAFATEGNTGFQFTKLDDNGDELPATATSWRCVQDNVTGLMWEVKAASDNTLATQGIEDPDDVFTWYETDTLISGGSAGYENTVRTCSGYDTSNPDTFCNTKALVNRVNQAQVCGSSDWRLPTRQELDSLVSLEGGTPVIDQQYFPETLAIDYWTSTPTMYSNRMAWAISFKTGEHTMPYRNAAYPVRLVREAE